MPRILVTGGAGFVGSHLVDALLEQGHAVRVFDDLSSGRRENLRGEVDFMYGDVTNPAAVEQAFDGVEACFHAASVGAPVFNVCTGKGTTVRRSRR